MFFFNGLTEAIQDEVATQDLPSTFDDLVELAIRIDKRLRLQRSGRDLTHILRAPSSDNSHQQRPSLIGLRAFEPMQVDCTRLSPGERHRRRDANAYLYCGEQGPCTELCPAKDRARQ